MPSTPGGRSLLRWPPSPALTPHPGSAPPRVEALHATRCAAAADRAPPGAGEQWLQAVVSEPTPREKSPPHPLPEAAPPCKSCSCAYPFTTRASAASSSAPAETSTGFSWRLRLKSRTKDSFSTPATGTTSSVSAPEEASFCSSSVLIWPSYFTLYPGTSLCPAMALRNEILMLDHEGPSCSDTADSGFSSAGMLTSRISVWWMRYNWAQSGFSVLASTLTTS